MSMRFSVRVFLGSNGSTKLSRAMALVVGGAAALIACSSSTTGGSSSSSGSCAELSACCTGISLDACKGIVAEGDSSTCTSALEVYCGIAGGSGSGSNGSGSGSGGGTETSSCLAKNGQTCANYKNVDSEIAPDLATNCMLQAGTMGTGCPTANLVGCCTQVILGASQEECYYSKTSSGGDTASTVTSVMSECAGENPAATFSATP